MQRYPIRAALFRRPNRTAGWDLCSFATETHPNPSNFTNRSKQQMSEIGRKGGRKGGKAKGVGGFHEMDPEKQHAIASRGGHAASKAGQRKGRPRGSQGTSAMEGSPSSSAPGFNESATS